MRTIEGPFCETCGMEVRHVDGGNLRSGYWVHIEPVEDKHTIRPQWRVINGKG